jgi:hypothetical protein
MRLAAFIRQNHTSIGSSWDEFARELSAFAEGMNLRSLRDHLATILQAITDGMEQPESAEQRLARAGDRDRRARLNRSPPSTCAPG